MNIKPLLNDIGLTANEVAVYVTLLSLSPTTVQILARKARIPRTTTYVVLEALEQHDLVTHYKDGNKTLIAAKPPQHLFRFIERQEHGLQRKRQDIERAMPVLQAMVKTNNEQLLVRSFNGVYGLRIMRQELLMRSTAGDTWYAFIPFDEAQVLLGDKDFFHVPRIAKHITTKVIFTTRSLKLKDKLLAQSRSSATEYLCVPPSTYKSNVGFIVSRDHIVFLIFAALPGGLVIENRSIVDAMREFFLLLWQRKR